MTLPARLIAHAECHEAHATQIAGDEEHRQLAADLREAAGLLETFVLWAGQVSERKDVPAGIRYAARMLSTPKEPRQ